MTGLDRARLVEMGENARRLAHRDAAKTVADAIESLVKER